MDWRRSFLCALRISHNGDPTGHSKFPLLLQSVLWAPDDSHLSCLLPIPGYPVYLPSRDWLACTGRSFSASAVALDLYIEFSGRLPQVAARLCIASLEPCRGGTVLPHLARFCLPRRQKPEALDYWHAAA